MLSRTFPRTPKTWKGLTATEILLEAGMVVRPVFRLGMDCVEGVVTVPPNFEDMVVVVSSPRVSLDEFTKIILNGFTQIRFFEEKEKSLLKKKSTP